MHKHICTKYIPRLEVLAQEAREDFVNERPCINKKAMAININLEPSPDALNKKAMAININLEPSPLGNKYKFRTITMRSIPQPPQPACLLRAGWGFGLDRTAVKLKK